MTGVAVMVGAAVVYDLICNRTGWQTISGGVRQLRCNEWGRMAVAAAGAALLTHLAEPAGSDGQRRPPATGGSVSPET